MNIVVLDAYSVNHGDLSWKGLESLGNVILYDRTSPNEIISRCKDAEIVLTNKVRFNRDTIASLPHLRYIGVMATGYDIIDIRAAREHGIVVTNVPAYSTTHVAQMVFSHMLNIIDYVDRFANENREGRWSKCEDFCYWDSPTHDLSAMTLGIIGLGNIGLEVAKIAHAFGMKVIAQTSKTQKQLPDYIEKTSQKELFQQSDVVTLHCPLNEETRDLVNKETLGWMKETAILINTGRGPLVDTSALYNVLKNNGIRAYAADVMSEEPPQQDNPLLTMPNVFLTPHIAWASQEARVRLISQLIINVEAFLKESPVNVVN